MKKPNSILSVVVGLALLGALGMGLATVLQNASRGGTPGRAVATEFPKGYPPPQATLALGAATPLQGYPPPPTAVLVPVSSPTLPAGTLPTPTPWIVVAKPQSPLPPVSTPLPTPVVTPIPVSIPLDIGLPPESAVVSYAVIIRDENVIRVANGDKAEARTVLDTSAQPSPFFLAGPSVGIFWAWGSPSPKGGQVALVSSNVKSFETLRKGESPKYGIFLLDVATGKMQPLVEDGVEPVWSPDGTRIAYRGSRTGSLWVVNVATGTTEELFAVDRSNLDYWVGWFTWSPDSKTIALVQTSGDMGGAGSIWFVDAEGQKKPLKLVSEDMLVDGDLSWSPANDQLLFLSHIGEHATPASPANIWVVDVTSGQQRQLTQNIHTGGDTPSWSPDGKWIVFDGINMLEGRPSYDDVWLVSVDGKELKRITRDAATDLAPIWVLGSNRIVFQKRGVGIYEVDISQGTFREMYSSDKVVDFLVLK